MNRSTHRKIDGTLDAARRLADYATAFDFLGKISGATSECGVVENVFDLFTQLFAPSTMIYLTGREGGSAEVLSRSREPFDLEATKAAMLGVGAEHAWTESGRGFDLVIGDGTARAILRVEGLTFAEYREHYLNLSLSVVPVIGLALQNARNFQRLRDEEAKLRAAVIARDTILGVVSHDLRSPLSAIRLNAAVIEERARKPLSEDVVARNARAIKRAVDRMNRLIEDLLDTRRIDAGVFTVRPTECLVPEILSETLQELRPRAEAKGIRIEETCAAGSRLVCDRDRIIQVLSNLLGNAIKFSRGAGGVVAVGCERRDDHVLFCVRDDGPGIPPEELPHVFDIYWQGREKKDLGAGLGLAIARAIVEAHGGRLWVESELGHGAAFFFSIPRGAAVTSPQA